MSEALTGLQILQYPGSVECWCSVGYRSALQERRRLASMSFELRDDGRGNPGGVAIRHQAVDGPEP